MKKSLMFLGAVSMLFTAVPVNALTFSSTDKESVHVLEERKIVEACPRGIGYQGFITSQGKPYYTDDDGENAHVIGSDNKCVPATVEEQLEFLNRTIRWERFEYTEEIPEGATTNYNLKVETDVIGGTGYIKTTDTKLDLDKVYYYLDEDNYMRMKANPVESELNVYYEERLFNQPKTVSFDDATLYVRGEYFIYTKLSKEDYDPAKIFDYYVMYEEDFEEIKYYSIDKEFYDLLESYDKYSVHFVNGTEDFYFFASSNDEESGKVTNVIYDKSGNKVGNFVDGSVFGLEFLSNGMIVATVDDKTGIYDKNYNLLITIDDFYGASETFMNSNEISLMGYGQENISEIKIFTLRKYEVLNGDEQKYKGEDTLSIRFSGDIKLFKNLYINDKLVDPKYYTVESGSTIITFKADYLAELGKGEFTAVVEYTDGGKATANFEIVSIKEEDKSEPEVPGTGDMINTYMVLLIVSGVGAYLLRKQLKTN